MLILIIAYRTYVCKAENYVKMFMDGYGNSGFHTLKMRIGDIQRLETLKTQCGIKMTYIALLGV